LGVLIYAVGIQEVVMRRMDVCLGLGLLLSLTGFIEPAAGNTYRVIFTGKVMMEDGSPPPFSVAIERVCSDLQGTAPGPLTNKKGEYVWNIEIDAYDTRVCYLHASHAGYVSSTQDISNINVTSHDPTYAVKPLVLVKSTPDPYGIVVSEDNIPGRSKSSFERALKELDKPDFAKAASLMEEAVNASPKFADGWHALGVVDERLSKAAEARDAYEHAIKANPKLVPPYVTLAMICIRIRDWDCAAKSAAAGIKADNKKLYPQLYIHQAVAEYQLKDLAGAEASVQEAMKLDPQRHYSREEYVLGRILEAKGDVNGAKEHMAAYLKLDQGAPDRDKVQTHLGNLGKPEAADPDPPLE